MIVYEQAGSFVNVYVDGYVFTAGEKEREWGFGDGDNSPERLETEAARRGMPADFFSAHYKAICNAAAGWDETEWTYRYNVISMAGRDDMMVRETMERAEEAITRNKAEKNRAKCQELLKRYISIGMIREYGLGIRQYIYPKDGGRARIVYHKNDLTPSERESLIPERVRNSVVHKA